MPHDIERPRVKTFIVFLRDARGGGALDAWMIAALLGVLLFAPSAKLTPVFRRACDDEKKPTSHR